MRKKIMLLVISVLFAGILAFLLNTGFLFAAENGHRVYSGNGDLEGCAAPGIACTPDMKWPI